LTKTAATRRAPQEGKEERKVNLIEGRCRTTSRWKTIVTTLCALSLAACAGPVNFVRVDGKAINPAELAQAKAICNGAAATSIRPTPVGSYVPSVNFGGGQMDEIGNNIAEAGARRAAAIGCMAQLGYIEAPRN
jgi:hypothetical protein